MGGKNTTFLGQQERNLAELRVRNRLVHASRKKRQEKKTGKIHNKNRKTTEGGRTASPIWGMVILRKFFPWDGVLWFEEKK